MKDKLDITLNIAGEILDLTIPRDEEYLLRRAATEINDVWSRWSRSFQGKSDRHVLTRVTLLFARGYLAQRMANEAVDGLLQQLDAELDDLLAGDTGTEVAGPQGG